MCAFKPVSSIYHFSPKRAKKNLQMRIKKLFFCILLLFFFCLEFTRGQNNGKTLVDVGVVTDVGTPYSEVVLLCINMSLADFYSSRPQLQTRLVVNVGDSKSDVVGAAIAGFLSSPLPPLAFSLYIYIYFVWTRVGSM